MKTHILFVTTFFLAGSVLADQPVINNNNSNGSPTVVQQCPPANQNNIYDPRVPPAGVYKTDNGDGSSSTTYTTGEKKPYITDNNCNSTAATVQPYVYGGPGGGPGPGPRPGPRR